MEWVSALPAVNASLNGLATVLLVAAFVAIKRGNRILHRKLMLSACGVSVLFLISYLVYHNNSGMTRFAGIGWSRTVYFFILFTHIPLAGIIVPLAATTLFLGLTERFDKHRKIARWTFPIWLYVSVTGVLVYFFLYQWFPSAGG
jgi:putative membrane protein